MAWQSPASLSSSPSDAWLGRVIVGLTMTLLAVQCDRAADQQVEKQQGPKPLTEFLRALPLVRAHVSRVVPNYFTGNADALYLSRAYAVMEQEAHLKPGTLARDLPLIPLSPTLKKNYDWLLDYTCSRLVKGDWNEAEVVAMPLHWMALAETEKPLEKATLALMLKGEALFGAMKYDEALRNYEDATLLTSPQRDLTLWVQMQNHTAWLCFRADKLGQMQEHLDRVLLNSSQFHGEKLPDALESRHMLALCLERMGKHDEAMAQLERATTDMKRVLGAEHPLALTARHDLAKLSTGSNRPNKTKSHVAELREVLAARLRVLGPDHPDTIKAHESLAGAIGYWSLAQALDLSKDATLQQDLKLEQKAEHRAAWEACVRTFGPDHPDTLWFRERTRDK